MTITDVNGNVLKTGKPAANWAAKHAGEIVGLETDREGRNMATFPNGNIAWYWPKEEHPKLVRRLGVNVMHDDDAETPSERYNREIYGDQWHTPMSL